MNALAQLIEKLWEKPSTHTYLTTIVNVKKTHSLKELVFETAKCAAIRGGTHSLIGLYEAWHLQQFFFSRNRLLSLVQMIWFCMAESRDDALDLQATLGTPPEPEDLTLDHFKRVFSEKKLRESYRLLTFLMRNESGRKEVYSFLLGETLSDQSELGFKFNLLVKTWQFCESMNWKDYHYFWFVVARILIHGSHESKFLSTDTSGVLNLRHPEGQRPEGSLSESFYNEFKNSLWNDEKSVTHEKLSGWAKNYSLNDLFEALKLVCAETILVSSAQHWKNSLSAAHFVQSTSESLKYLTDEYKVEALWSAVHFVKNFSILCKPFTQPSIVSLETIDEQNNALFFLEWCIKKGNSGKALGTLETLSDQGKIEKNPILQELLAFLSGMNTYSIFMGNDVQFANSVLKNYKNATHDLKNIYLKALVKLLSESPKELTILNSLMNTQEIHRGYYTSGGEFSF